MPFLKPSYHLYTVHILIWNKIEWHLRSFHPIQCERGGIECFRDARYKYLKTFTHSHHYRSNMPLGECFVSLTNMTVTIKWCSLSVKKYCYVKMKKTLSRSFGSIISEICIYYIWMKVIFIANVYLNEVVHNHLEFHVCGVPHSLRTSINCACKQNGASCVAQASL